MEGINLDKIRIKKDKPEPKWKALLNKDIQFGSAFSDKKKETLYNDLFLLLNAGLDIKRVLELIRDEQKNKKDKKIIEDIYNRVLEGGGLSDALKQSGLFSKYECFAVQIGEESGLLTDVLEHLKKYFEKKIEQRRQVIAALSYPLLVMFVAFGAVLFMIGFVVPTFAETFKKFDIELPLITKVVIQLSNSFDKIMLVIVIIAATIFAFVKINKNKPWFLSLKDKILLKLPIFGPIIKLGHLTSFCQSMAMLVSAKTPLIEALKLLEQMTGSYTLSRALNESYDKVVQGEYLSACLARYPFFPTRMIYLMNVGEEVNKLDEIFHQLSDLYSKELEYRSKVLSTVIEPILIVFLGFVVGFILVAMYLPMFSITEMLGK